MNYQLIGNILLIVAAIVLIFTIRKQDKKIDNLKNAKKEEIREIFKDEWNAEEKTYKQKRADQETTLRILDEKIKEREPRYQELHQNLKEFERSQMKAIDALARSERKRQEELTQRAVKDYENLALEKLQEEFERCEIKRAEINSELEELGKFLEEERAKKAALNEEILRQRALEEEQDFYRIQFNTEDESDITILRDAATRLRHPAAVNKIIWSEYYQKPLAELRKRVAIEGPGVYKITRLKTKEVYIGQAVNVSTRWADHVKSALGVGTLASSQLHLSMAQDGPENFTFELLEKVPKEKLRERESYWIDFYDSKNYGLNTISGDKK